MFNSPHQPAKTKRLLLTQTQLINQMLAWDVYEALPFAGERLLIELPPHEHLRGFELATIEKTQSTTDHGDPLWCVSTSSRDGQVAEQCANDAHVAAYRLKAFELNVAAHWAVKQEIEATLC